MIGIYIRYSTEKQDSKSQRHAVKTYALNNKIDLTGAKEYLDERISGSINDRKNFKRLLYDIDKGLVTTVLTTELSRMSRDMLYLLNVINEIKTRGAKLITVTEGEINFKNSMDIFMVVAKSFVAMSERELISRRTKEALTELKSKGVKLGAKNPIGRAKYKYRPDPELVEEVVKLRKEGLSFDRIARETKSTKDIVRRIYRRLIILRA